MSQVLGILLMSVMPCGPPKQASQLLLCTEQQATDKAKKEAGSPTKEDSMEPLEQSQVSQAKEASGSRRRPGQLVKNAWNGRTSSIAKQESPTQRGHTTTDCLAFWNILKTPDGSGKTGMEYRFQLRPRTPKTCTHTPSECSSHQAGKAPRICSGSGLSCFSRGGAKRGHCGFSVGQSKLG